MEPTEAQYLMINALETLSLLLKNFYDSERGIWHLKTSSTAIPIACFMPDGEVQSLEAQL